MPSSKRKRFKEVSEHFASQQFGGFEVEGVSQVWPADDPLEWRPKPKSDFMPWHGSQDWFLLQFHRELFERSGSDFFRKALLSGNIEGVRRFFIAQLLSRFIEHLRRNAKLDFRLPNKVYEQAPAVGYWVRRRWEFYLTLATMTGLVSLDECSSIIRAAPYRGELETVPGGGTLRDRKKRILEGLLDNLRREAKATFSSIDQVVQRVRQEQEKAAKVGMKVSYCLYPGTFRPFTIVHAFNRTALSWIVGRTVWLVTGDKAYDRIVEADEKARRNFTAHEVLTSITSLPCFREHDDIVESDVIMREGTAKYANQLRRFEGVDYVYVGARDEPLFQKRVEAARLAGKKIISGPQFGIHGSDIQAYYRRLIEMFKIAVAAQGKQLSDEQMQDLLPELMKWR